MPSLKRCVVLSGAVTGLFCLAALHADEELAPTSADEAMTQVVKPLLAKDDVASTAPVQQNPLPAFLQRGVAWLIAAQHEDGGWGGGSHANQKVRDPHGVTTDPATTSFPLLSLMRCGHTPLGGEHQAQVRRGLEYLLATVEKANVDGPLITSVQGTQPQTKLGRLVDTSMTWPRTSILPAATRLGHPLASARPT